MVFGQREVSKPWKAVKKIKKNFPKNIIFANRFLLHCVKIIFFDLKLWGPLKNSKTRSGSYSGLGLSINVRKRNENLVGLSF
jgi:hypothetical protein